jgi:hypothetical protein
MPGLLEIFHIKIPRPLRYFLRFYNTILRTGDVRTQHALSDLYRRNGSRWTLQKGVIDATLLTISDTQTLNGTSKLLSLLFFLIAKTFTHRPKVLDYSSPALFSLRR